MSISFQFEGFANTPTLWIDTLFGAQQLSKPLLKGNSNNILITKSLKLGYLVERFVLHQLQITPKTKVIAHNLQISGIDRTLGEFDFIFSSDSQVYHVEVAYKFYLYDPDFGSSTLEHWIGPNRNDSFVRKMDKIVNHQFPLLKTKEARSTLHQLHLSPENILQRVLFKGQLFLPYEKEVDINPLNPECISGYYINRNQISSFERCKFHFPDKHDWLTTPRTHTDWKTYKNALAEINNRLDLKNSPMVWIKHPNGTLNKMFIVWW